MIDLHQRAFNLENLSAARQSLEKLVNGDADAWESKPVPLSSFSPKAKAKAEPKPKTRVDAKLVAKALAQCSDVPFTPTEAATAFDFTKLLLETILRPADKPIVFANQYEPIIGFKARVCIRLRPDTLQYLCSCKARWADKNKADCDDGTNRKRNLKERIFLDVEFDHMPLGDQLKILWWLKRVKG